MAYWVGGSGGNWADPTKWSSSSGGTAADTLGSDLLSGWDFTSGWTIANATIIDDNNSFTTTGAGGINKSLIVVGKAYKIVISGTTSSTNILIVSGGANDAYSSSLSGTFNSTFYFQAKANTILYIRNASTGTTNITTFTCEEVTCFPSSTVDAIFDANSFSSDSQTVTINAANCACANLDFSAIDQTVTFANSTYTDFKVYGNLVLPATKLTWSFTGTGYCTLAGTGSQTITTNGMTSNMNRLYFDGVGGTWTNQDAANFGSTSLYLKNGTWATNNQTITSTGSFVTETGTKVLTLGSSTFNIGTWNNAVPTGLTITSAGNTSTVNITATSTITGATTFYNLTLTGVAAVTAQISLAANITVSNVFTPTGNNATNYRLLIASNTIGTARTITAASVSETYCDYRDITMAGACLTGGTLVLPADGLRGDCGGNTAITFTTGIPLYYKHTSGACTWKDISRWRNSGTETLGSDVLSGWDFTSGWTTANSTIIDNNSFSTTGIGGIQINSLTTNKVYKVTIVGNTTASSFMITEGSVIYNYSGGLTGSFSTSFYFMNYGSVVYFRNASAGTTNIITLTCEEVTNIGRVPLPQDSAILDANSFTGTSTLTIDVPRCGSVDMSAVSQAVGTVMANNCEYYGHSILGDNITPSDGYIRTFMGRGNYNFNFYGKTIAFLYIKSGTYTNLGNITCLQLFVYIGTTLNMGNFTYNITTTTTSNGWYGEGTINADTSTIKLNTSSGSANPIFVGGGKTYYNVWFSGTHTGYFDITGSNTFNELKIDAGRKVRITAGTTQTVSKLNAVGTQANPITIQSVTNAVHDLALASGQPNPQCDWLILHNSRCNVSFYAGNGSANVPPKGNGLLYNWYAVAGIDGTGVTKTLAPAGCHIPTSTEWATLSTYLGGDSVSGGKLKSINSIFWNTPNTGATNESGFYAFGNGARSETGIMVSIGTSGSFWCKDTNTRIYLLSENAILGNNVTDQRIGRGVRCIVDTIPANGIITDVDGNRYGIVTIGTQTWLTSNLKTTKYADGTAIPNVTGNLAWAALTTGAYCSYNNAAIVEYPANNTNWVLANQSKGMLNFF